MIATYEAGDAFWGRFRSSSGGPWMTSTAEKPALRQRPRSAARLDPPVRVVAGKLVALEEAAQRKVLEPWVHGRLGLDDRDAAGDLEQRLERDQQMPLVIEDTQGQHNVETAE
jgi:hypothetical protein